MRTRLLEATVATLFDRGYSRTTTTEIAKRARVSRGAQLHHFPTKDELVITALRHLFIERTREFHESFQALPASADRATAAIDLLWQMLSGPTFYAWLELVVAARTNPKLRRVVKPLAEEFVGRVQDTFRRLFPKSALPVAPHFAFALLQGLAVDSIVLPDAPHVGFILEQLRALARLVLLHKEPPK